MLSKYYIFTVFIILVFVLSIAVKAITRGVEAKQIIKEEKNLDLNKKKMKFQNLEVINQIKRIKRSYMIKELLMMMNLKKLKKKY